jgi:hypothetical protein
VKRYFRRDGDWPGVGTGSVWLEFEGDYATRQVELYDGKWHSSIDKFHPDLGGSLTHEPLSVHEFVPSEEIAAEEFEKAWDEALKYRRGTA